MTELTQNVVHVWYTYLRMISQQEDLFLSYLSIDEISRAERFHFPIHRERFIAARGMLRKLLGEYLNLEPNVITFSYNANGKPFLENTNIEFNISHSNDIAVYAFTQSSPIGVDIEKAKETYEDAVAKRYFSEEEYADLNAMPDSEKAQTFYRIWSRKEAVIKALGKGIIYPLSSFSVPVVDSYEPLRLTVEGAEWHLQSMQIDENYQSAFVTQQVVKKVLQRKCKGLNFHA